MVRAAELEAARIQDLYAALRLELAQLRQVAFQVAPLPVVARGQIIREVRLVVQLERRLHVDADRGLLLEQEIEELAVPRPDLLQRAHREHARAGAQLEPAVRLEEVEGQPLDVDAKLLPEKIHHLIRRLGPVKPVELLARQLLRQGDQIEAAAAAELEHLAHVPEVALEQEGAADAEEVILEARAARHDVPALQPDSLAG